MAQTTKIKRIQINSLVKSQYIYLSVCSVLISLCVLSWTHTQDNSYTHFPPQELFTSHSDECSLLIPEAKPNLQLSFGNRTWRKNKNTGCYKNYNVWDQCNISPRSTPSDLPLLSPLLVCGVDRKALGLTSSFQCLELTCGIQHL